MLAFKKWNQPFKLIFEFLKDYYEFAKPSLQARYHIEEINLKANQVIIRCRYSRSYIKSTIDDVISAPGIVEHLSPLQACWLGYYYATPPKEIIKKTRKQRLGFKPQVKSGRFRVVSLEMRTNILTYHDTQTNRVYKEKVTQVAQDRFVINHIDPTQACYIGMQAGFIVARHGDKVLFEKESQPIFKLVK